MLKRLVTVISLVAALGQPALAQSAPWGDLPGAPGASSAQSGMPAVFPGGQFPGGGRLPPGFFPGGQFPGVDQSGGQFPGGQFPPGSSSQQPIDPRTYPYPYWLPKGKTTNRGVGRRFFLPPTSTSSVDLDITDGLGGSPPPTFSEQPLPVNVPSQRFTPQQIPETFPGGRFPSP